MSAKLKWRVAEAPTGPYRSFSHRSWPSADYPDGNIAGFITCDDSYVPAQAKAGTHPPLHVYVSSYATAEQREAGAGTFTNRHMKATFATLPEAKAALERYLAEHPEVTGGHLCTT